MRWQGGEGCRWVFEATRQRRRAGGRQRQRVAKQANIGCSVRRVEMEHGGRQRPIAGAAAYSVDAGGDRAKVWDGWQAARAARACIISTASKLAQAAQAAQAERESSGVGYLGSGACVSDRRQRRRRRTGEGGRPRTKRVCGWRRVPRCIQASSSALALALAPCTHTRRTLSRPWKPSKGAATGHDQLQPWPVRGD
jgi:hypothetical protein